MKLNANLNLRKFEKIMKSSEVQNLNLSLLPLKIKILIFYMKYEILKIV